MNAIQIFKEGSEGYKALHLAAEMLTYFHPQGWKYYVGECYFDHGQGWMWTTILCHKPDSVWGDFQALYPAQQERILTASKPGEMAAVIQELFDKW